MKRIYAAAFIAAAAMAAISASGQTGGGIPLLDKAPQYRVTFDYTLTYLKAGGSPAREVTGGSVIVEDRAFFATGMDLELISDGESRWTVDRAAGEVVVEKADAGSVITNPALLFATYRDYLDRITVNSSGEDFLDVTVKVDEDVSERFVLKDIRFLPKEGKRSGFTLDVKSLPDDFVVTDLR